MKVLILAGGRGRRFQSARQNIPKQMLDVNGFPFVEYIIEELKKEGLLEFVFCLYYKASLIQDYFEKKKDGLTYLFSIEKEARDTGGAVKLAEKFIKEDDFIVVNGDTYLEIDIKKMISFHRQKKSLATIALAKVADVSQRGLVKMGENDKIELFVEKLTNLHIAGWVNAGVYILRREVLDLIAKNTPVSLEKELFPSLLVLGRPIYGFRTKGKFIDINTTADYQRAKQQLR